jgi:hypothetical protein
MSCCCKPTGRRRARKEEEVDLLDSGLGNIPVAPPHKVVKGKDGLPGIRLENGESIVMPNRSAYCYHHYHHCYH